MPVVVSDTSPVRALAHLNLLTVLPALFGRVLIPPIVQRELAYPPSGISNQPEPPPQPRPPEFAGKARNKPRRLRYYFCTSVAKAQAGGLDARRMGKEWRTEPGRIAAPRGPLRNSNPDP